MFVSVRNLESGMYMYSDQPATLFAEVMFIHKYYEVVLENMYPFQRRISYRTDPSQHHRASCLGCPVCTVCTYVRTCGVTQTLCFRFHVGRQIMIGTPPCPVLGPSTSSPPNNITQPTTMVCRRSHPEPHFWPSRTRYRHVHTVQVQAWVGFVHGSQLAARSGPLCSMLQKPCF